MTQRFNAAYGAVLAVLLGTSCGGESAPRHIAEDQGPPLPAESAHTSAEQAEQTVSDSTPHSERVAVYMEASAEDLQRMRAQYSEDDYAVVADDLMYYRAGAYEYLETQGVPIVRLEGRRPLTFLVAGRRQQYDFSGESTLDLAVLYEPGREPKPVAPVDIHLAADYFGSGKNP